MNTSDDPTRPPSLIDVEVLDLGPLYEEAVSHYLSLDANRGAWSEERKRRLRIRTECRWGRVQLEEDKTFLLNERGDGPRAELSGEVKAYVALYAEMISAPGDPGFFEKDPFCKVAIDKKSALAFRTLGIVTLEAFIRSKVPEMEAAYDAWLCLLRDARQRVRAKRSRVPA